jgi:HlyD family secretion protein
MTTTTTKSTPKRNARGGKLRRFIAPGIVIALLAAIGWGLRPLPTEVELGKVDEAEFTMSVIEEGKTRIRHRYMVSPPIAGMLRRITLRPGARVEAGKTVLAEIEAAPVAFLDERTRAEAEARVRATEASKSQRETMVEHARTAYDLADKERKRSADLKRGGLIAQSEWDKAESHAMMVERELHASEFALKVAGFELEQARAALTQAGQPVGEKREPITLIAPVSGYILQVFEENARAVTPGVQLLEVGDPTDLEAEIEMLSTDAVGVKEGAEVSIENWGGPRPLRGRVALVEPGGYTKISALGVEEQRVKVRVDFAEELPPGVTFGDRYRVEARIVTGHADRALQVPAGALFRRGGDWMSFAIDGGHARLTRVEIGRHNGQAAEVIKGLSAGQRVVLHPPDTLADGMAVTERK